MKNQLKFILFGIIACTIIMSCEKLENTIKEKAGGPEFSIDSFEQNIIAALDGRAVGYSYSISQNGNQVRDGGGGFALTAIDNGGVGFPHGPNKRQEIASCSKTLTALALLSIMQETGMTGDENMYKYLPKGWLIGNSSFKNISIRDLIRHEGGIANGGIGYEDLRSRAVSNITYVKGPTSYANINYAFLRTVIAYASPTADLASYEESLKAFGVLTIDDHKKLDSAISQIYIDEVNKRVFSPCGIKYTRPTTEGEYKATKNYNFNNTTPGFYKGDMTKYVGSTGWRLSTTEQNAIMVYLKHTDKILNNEWKKKMNDNLLGWSLASSQEVTGGMAYMHGGYHEDQFGMPDKQAPTPMVRGCFAVQVIFPNGVECALQVNSLGGTNNMETTVVPCYENAWIDN